MTSLRAPFPWFGGKSLVAELVWDRFGNVHNYVEPFAGSLAVLLKRPHAPAIETVNDVDAYLANFWVALKRDPRTVAEVADDPVNETLLHSRHQWLVDHGGELKQKMLADPDYFDPRIAGWWVWGISQWIGNGWCSHQEKKQRPHLSAGMGVHRKLPNLGGPSGVHRQLPHLGDSGTGVHRGRPHVTHHGNGVHQRSLTDIYDYFEALAARLRRVRVCCGDWQRILGPSPTTKQGLTGVFLDPPYDMRVIKDSEDSDGNAPTDVIYNHHNSDVSRLVTQWAVEHGDDPLLRIAVCGYQGEHRFPETWECVAWKAPGGYGSQGDGQGRENAARERIWFSPHCLRPALFTLADWRPLEASTEGVS
jgi:DNA adenine methylase